MVGSRMPRILEPTLSNAPAHTMKYPVYLYNLHYAREAANKPAIIFPRFAELPTEIRWKIWRLICEQPRDVRVFLTYMCTSPNPEPPVFNVCREARRLVAEKYVSGCFELGASFKSPRPIYVNLRVDTIFIYAWFLPHSDIRKLCQMEGTNDLTATWKTVKMSAGRASMVCRDARGNIRILNVIVAKNLKDSEESHIATHLVRIGGGRQVHWKELLKNINNLGNFSVLKNDDFRALIK